MTDERKTPEEWCAEYKAEIVVPGKDAVFCEVEILDPDGWDRSNFEEDWQKSLTLEEFVQKLYASTIRFKL